MANGVSADQLQRLEDRIARLEKAPVKDRWDKVQIAVHVLAALLIPLALALAGHYFSTALAEAQIASEERREQASIAIAESSMRVSQAELIATFMRSLLSPDATERQLAIRAVLLALPEAGPQLVAQVQAASDDPAIKTAAAAALDERREALVRDVYAGDEAVREQAAADLVMGFRRDPKLVDAITRESERHGRNRRGMYSAGLVLEAVPADRLQSRRAAVRKFTDLARRGDERSRQLAARIDEKIAPPAAE